MRRLWLTAVSVALAQVATVGSVGAQAPAPGRPAAAVAPAAAPVAPAAAPAAAPPAAAPTPAAATPAAASAATPGAPPAAAAPGATPEAPAAAPAPAPEVQLVAPVDTDQRMDLGLARLKGKSYKDAASAFYHVYQSLPLTDSRRDVAGYHLADTLVELGFTQAAAEHYMEILSGRRTPELMDKALGALKPLYERRLVSEGRFVDGVLYGAQYTDLSPDVADFVEYLQALTDVRHGFAKWGRARLETLAHANRQYSFSARYALVVQRIALKEDDPAATELRDIISSTAEIPFEIRNKARLALGRILYEKKLYDEAWQIYSQVDSPLPLQDVVMIERAWDRVANGDQQRALGLLVGLGAPVFHDIFAPERLLIRGIALRRLCQYRAAHLAVRDFRTTYGKTLEKIKGRSSLRDDPTIRGWAVAATQALRDHSRIRDVLTRERALLGSVGDKSLQGHLDAVYASGLATATEAIDRDLDQATEIVADELLRIDEQMSLVDYEIGAGLFRSNGEGAGAGVTQSIEVPYGSQTAYFKFDGEYWSDELGDYAVLAADRCVR